MSPTPGGGAQAPLRRVNVPAFNGDIRFDETAVFWFGKVDNSSNHTDVRMGYNQIGLYVRTQTFDRWLWYNPNPSEDLTNADAVSLYLGIDGVLFRLDAQVNWWEERSRWQAAYRRIGDAWTRIPLEFTTRSGWRGNGLNQPVDGRGWTMDFDIPFASLGLAGTPASGTVWGLAIAVHDRDDAAFTPMPDQVWPDGMQPHASATWGTLRFGIPPYSAPGTRSNPPTSTLIRQGLNGATVPDADVGGGSVCGDPAGPEYFPTWGQLNYAGRTHVTIANQGDVADWPCFSKYYVTFPLEQIPAGKVILSASLKLHMFGNFGESASPHPSYIHVHSVDQAWDERTLTWNNAPLARENVAGTWVDVMREPLVWPGVPYSWDLSRAVAEAHALGTPLRLVLYESDWNYHSGKFFSTSEVGDWNAVARPTLTVVWGDPL
jgi:hypothetical protein